MDERWVFFPVLLSMDFNYYQENGDPFHQFPMITLLDMFKQACVQVL